MYQLPHVSAHPISIDTPHCDGTFPVTVHLYASIQLITFLLNPFSPVHIADTIVVGVAFLVGIVSPFPHVPFDSFLRYVVFAVKTFHIYHPVRSMWLLDP